MAGDQEFKQKRASKNDVCVRSQRMFQDFLEEFKENNENKYMQSVIEMELFGKYTLLVNFEDVQKYNPTLAIMISEEYYRIYSYLCKSVSNFIDHVGLKFNKDCYVSFTQVPMQHKLRNIITFKFGTLISVSGIVVHIHPVLAELVSATFRCLVCQTEIRNIKQKFQVINPTACRNPFCKNTTRYKLDAKKSVYKEFQRIRIQEAMDEVPIGSVPRALEIILREELFGTVEAGLRYNFTGTYLNISDVNMLLKGRNIIGRRPLISSASTVRTAFLASSLFPIEELPHPTEIPVPEPPGADMVEVCETCYWKRKRIPYKWKYHLITAILSIIFYIIYATIFN